MYPISTSTRIFFVASIFVFFAHSSFGQETVETLTSKSFSREGNELVVKFRLPDRLKYTYDVESASMYSGRYNLVIMESIRGELRDLSPGQTYKLYWNVIEDIEEFDEPVEAKINLRYTTTALRKVEEEVFKNCRSIRDYETYRSLYPQGRFRAEAQQKIEALRSEQEQERKEREAMRAEDSAWRTATREDTPASYNAYLFKYPNGRYAAKARQELDRIEKEAKDDAKTFRNTKKPFVAIGFSVSGGLNHLPFINDDSAIQDATPQIDNGDFDVSYNYSLATFLELRLANLTYWHISGALANRNVVYVPKNFNTRRTLRYQDLRLVSGFHIKNWFLGGYYALNVRAAELEYDTFSENILEKHPDFLLNDFGVSIGLETPVRKERITKDYQTNNIVFGIGYDLSLAGLLDNNYDQRASVDPVFAFGNPDVQLGVLYLKLGIRL
ncbi:MAG: hypothetical protein AAF847_08005 [Bacteroidota bacterium]